MRRISPSNKDLLVEGTRMRIDVIFDPGMAGWCQHHRGHATTNHAVDEPANAEQRTRAPRPFSPVPDSQMARPRVCGKGFFFLLFLL